MLCYNAPCDLGYGRNMVFTSWVSQEHDDGKSKGCPPSIWTLLIRTLFACGTPPKNGCLGFQGHPAVGFTAQKKNPWHSSASGTPPVFCMVFLYGFLLNFFAPKKCGGLPNPQHYCLVAAETVTPSRNRTAKKKLLEWSTALGNPTKASK